MSEAPEATDRRQESFKIAAIGDLHVSADRPGSFRELFAEMSREANAIVLCGDLTDTGQPKQVETLAEDLRGSAVPVIAVLGNHDFESGQSDAVSEIMRKAGVHLLN